NLSKTNIYDEDEGYYHFQIKENQYLDSIEKVKKGDANYSKVCKELHRNFKNHLKDTKPKYWDKISKRYITSYGKLKLQTLLNILADVYVAYPGLRQNLMYYLAGIGYTKRTVKSIKSILDLIDVFDDISLYQVCYIIT